MSALSNNEISLGKFLSHSFFLHLIFIGGFWYWGKSHISVLLDDNRRDYTIVESSVKVSVVAMPSMSFKELKKLDETAPEISDNTQPESAGKDESENSFKKVNKKKNFSDLLKALSKKKVKTDQLKNKVSDKTSKTSKKVQKALAKLAAKGNKLSDGTKIIGSGSGQVGGLLAAYASGIPNHVRPHWSLPSYLIDQDLRCRVRVWIGGAGQLLKSKIHESSGNSEFDKKALRAVSLSAPFPKPDGEIVDNVLKGDIVLGFPL